MAADLKGRIDAAPSLASPDRASPALASPSLAKPDRATYLRSAKQRKLIFPDLLTPVWANYPVA